MKRFWKTLCRGAAPFLAAAMLVFLVSAVKSFLEVLPAESYVDKGVYTFTATSGYPTTRQGSYQPKYHRYSTKYVYVVIYQSAEGWRWEREFAAESLGQRAVQAREQVERRVLSIVGENSYITVEPEYTPQRYAAHLRQSYLTIGGICLGVLAVEGVVWLLVRRKKAAAASTS